VYDLRVTHVYDLRPLSLAWFTTPLPSLIGRSQAVTCLNEELRARARAPKAFTIAGARRKHHASSCLQARWNDFKNTAAMDGASHSVHTLASATQGMQPASAAVRRNGPRRAVARALPIRFNLVSVSARSTCWFVHFRFTTLLFVTRVARFMLETTLQLWFMMMSSTTASSASGDVTMTSMSIVV
jgi:hypothetical protein